MTMLTKQANKTPHNYSAVMLEFDGTPAADKVRKLSAGIPDADLDPTEGREDIPHVTVLYGLHDAAPDKAAKLLKGSGPVKLKFGKVSLFEATETKKPFDVVKIEVDSPDLHRLNQTLRSSLPYSTKHPEYKPHATLAYVKAGKGKSYVGQSGLEGVEVTADKLVFQNPANERTVIDLNQAKAAGDLSAKVNRLYQAKLARAERVKPVAMLKQANEGWPFNSNTAAAAAFGGAVGVPIGATIEALIGDKKRTLLRRLLLGALKGGGLGVGIGAVRGIREGYAQDKSASADLDKLKSAKSDSDRGDYAAKAAKLVKMMTERPQDWKVDDASGRNVGVTHLPTGFRLHMPALAVPTQVKRAVDWKARLQRRLTDRGEAVPQTKQADNFLYKLGPLHTALTLRNFGPLPAAVAKTAIGYGGGKLLANLLFKDLRTRKGMGRTMGLVGALGMNALTIPDIAAQMSLAREGKIKGIDPNDPWAGTKSLFNPFPYAGLFGKSSSFTMGELAELQPGDMGLPAAPHMYGGFSPYNTSPHTSVSAAANAVMSDTTLNPMEKARALYAIDLADAGTDNRGLVTTGDLIRGAIGAGMGAMAGRVLGAVGGLPAATQRRMARIGALGGMLRATGIWTN